jgi:5-methylcytosine-specific restriction endonuclease McrA
LGASIDGWFQAVRQSSRGLGLNPRALGENPKAKKRRERQRLRIKREGKVEPFYMTEAWRALRYQVLRSSDGRCTLCGRSKPRHGVTLHVDHIKPRSHFPELELERSNLQVLCEDCNLGKGNSDMTDWRR